MPDKKYKPRFDDPARKTTWRNDCRRVEVPNKGTWQWKTDGIVIYLYAPDGSRHSFAKYEAYGMTEDEYWAMRAAQDFEESDLLVEPSMIRDYIKNDFKPVFDDAS